MDTLHLLLGTVLLRSYVFIFLAIYLTIAIINMGIIRSLIFTLLAYGIAFASEYSSTRNGFPYGHYSYIDKTRDQELWISNVPFMDSLSYSFLVYISFTFSLLLWSQLDKKGWDIRLVEDGQIRRSWRVILTGAVLFMLMDVIIDPVALRGDRWFLGKIYFYGDAGEYFNIPLTNFGGWFLVGTAILFTFTRIESWLEVEHMLGPYNMPAKALYGPALYFSVLIFNLIVTFYIGEPLIGICGIIIFLALLSLALFKTLRETFRSVTG